MHQLLVAAQLIVVQVIDDDVVRTSLTVAQTTGRLTATAGKELHTTLGLELALLPATVILLLPEVSDEPLVVFQLCLDVAEQSVGIVLRLAHDHHKVDEPLRLEHQPERRENIKVRRFGMTAWPHEHRLQVRRVAYLACRLVVERRIVNGAYDLAGRLVAQLEEMWKVILAERCIVTQQTLDAHIPLHGCFAFEKRRVRNGLHLPAPLFPFLVCLFLFRCCCHRLPSVTLCPSAR